MKIQETLQDPSETPTVTECPACHRVDDQLAEHLSEIQRISLLAEDLEKLLVEFVDASYARALGDDGLRDDCQSCIQCGSVKRQRHKPDCVVGRSEALLAHLEA